jgi:hypothetical protein
MAQADIWLSDRLLCGMGTFRKSFNVRSYQGCWTKPDNVTRSRNGAEPDFLINIIYFERLADRCSIDEVAVAVTKPSVQAITTGEAQHR